MSGDGKPEPFAQRRRTVLDRLGGDAAMVLPAAPELVAGRDIELRYVPDADLWYLTGCAEPEAVAVLCPRADAPFTLFVRDRDPERERWTGPRGGVDAARERSDADAVHPVSELPDRLPALLREVDRVFFRLGTGRDDLDRRVLHALTAGRAGRQRTGRGPAQLADPGLILDELRLVKEPAEIDAIRAAVDLTTEAFRRALAAVRPGTGEWEIEAALEGGFRRAGAEGPAFATIAASGTNATILHYTANDRRMEGGELLLIDAGARHRRYNADVTRTIPVGGAFSAAQRTVYDIVLAAERAAIQAVRPGAGADDPHHAAVAILARGMVDLGLLQGDPDELAGQPDTLKRFYPHRTSHWLGLDVHDVGTYARAGAPRSLQPGMVLTIEPGLYIPVDTPDAPEEFRGIGIRIEDDLLVTDDGHDVLSARLPTEPDALVDLVG